MRLAFALLYLVACDELSKTTDDPTDPDHSDEEPWGDGPDEDEDEECPDGFYLASDGNCYPNEEADADTDADSDADSDADADADSDADTDADTEPVFDPCPSGVTCVESFPYEDSWTTTGGDSDLDAYSCASSTDESGPERVYRLDLPSPGYIAARLSDLGSGVDVDVHLLEELDADTCLARGHWDAGTLYPAGSYYLVVDSWVNGSGDVKDGDYTLTIGYTPYDGYTGEGLREDTLEIALRAFDRGWMWGDTESFTYAVIDFELPSFEPRLWLLNLATGEAEATLYVAHGAGSSDPYDSAYAISFSNTPDSYQSSLGLVKAAETYWGDYGYSLRLDGLEDGFNDNVRDRAIVMHPWYASAEEVAYYGQVPETLGCPGVDEYIAADLEDILSDEGALIFSYYPDPDYLSDSDYASP